MNSGASRALLPPGHGFGLGFAVRKNLGVAAVPGSMCGGQMRIIAFITHSADIRQILDHIGVESEPPHIAPARGPPLWDDCGDALAGEGTPTEPDWATGWDEAAQPAPDYELDQRINWWLGTQRLSRAAG